MKCETCRKRTAMPGNINCLGCWVAWWNSFAMTAEQRETVARIKDRPSRVQQPALADVMRTRGEFKP